MADDGLVPLIMQYMRKQNDGICSTSDLVRHLKVKRKQLNVELYRLKRQNVTLKIQESPPVWQLQGDAQLSHRIKPNNVNVRSNSPRFRGKKFGFKRGKAPYRKKAPHYGNFSNSSKPVDPSVFQDIIAFLESQGAPVKTIDIAKALGFLTSSQINPALYGLRNHGRVTVTCEKPTMWMLNRNTSSGEFCLQSSNNSLYNESYVGFQEDEDMENDEKQCDEFSFQSDSSAHQTYEDSLSVNSLQGSKENMYPVNNTTHTQATSQNASVMPASSSLTFEDISRMQGNETVGEGALSTSSSLSSIQHLDTSDNLETGQALVKMEVNSPPLSQAGDMSMIDNALSTLLDIKMQMAKPFIIASKMKIPVDEMDKILQECRKFKYVSFQNNICVLSKKGEEYIRDKLNKDKVIDSVQPDSIDKQRQSFHHTGLPLSPFELVNKENGTFAAKSVGSAASHSIRPSLVSGPQPLMQVNLSASPIHRLMKLSQTNLGTLPSKQNVHPSVIPQLTDIQHSLQSSQSEKRFDSLPVGITNQTSNTQTPNIATRPDTMGSVQCNTKSSGFKLPLTPVDLVRQQLKKTDISSTCVTQTYSCEASVSQPVFSTSTSSLSNTGRQLLFSPQQRTLPQQPQSLPVMAGNMSMFSSGSKSLDISTESFAAVNKNPVSALMEYAQSRHKVARIEVIHQSGPSHRPKFTMGVFIGDKQYSQVQCTNKKDGRKEAADMALRSLIASGQYNTEKPPTNLVPTSQMTHFDKVAALTHQQFNSLVAGISENFAGRKVIAGLVMKTSENDLGTVISLGTGNRCITGHQLSLEGNTVNDSHAEIITRRGFIRFLYKKLLTSEPNTPNGLFETAPSGKLRMRAGISFHLYISTAPCGDGALFSPRDTASNNAPLQSLTDKTHHPTFTSNVQGLLRTKMEGGEGTIPIEPEFTVQTFDGIQRGERLRTMSCTDKICRWNVVGMQGALLSHFLEPVYLDSLTLGFLFDPGHLARAVCCRVDKGDMKIDSLLPKGYHLNHPWLGRVTAVEPSRETQKTKSLSINWCYGDEKAEVTDGTQGLCYTSIEKGFFSRCTKKNLYTSFKQCCEKYGRSDLLQSTCYNQTKMAATSFQQAKQVMVKKFAENKYGPWVSKPVEEEMFS